ncbi:hypothetical protein Droror1_Dr00017696 [Drosera rotundifolia]
MSMATPSTASTCSSSLTHVHPFQKSDKFALPTYSKSFLVHSTTWANQSSTVLHSSASPSPIAEQANPAPPMMKFTYHVADSDDLVQTHVGNHNKFIIELLRNPNTEDLALEFYQEAKRNHPGFRPNGSTVTMMLRFFVRTKKWDMIAVMCDDLVEYGVFPDMVSSAGLIGDCVRARKFRVVESLLDAFRRSNGDRIVVFGAFHAALRGYNKLHMYGSTISLYERMRSFRIPLYRYGYISVMEACMKTNNTSKVVELFNAVEAEGMLDWSPFSTQVYSILIESLGRLKQGKRALEYFHGVVEKGGSFLNASIYSSLIGSFAEMGEVEAVKSLMAKAEGKWKLKDPEMFMKVVLMYVDKGLVEKNLDVVKTMQANNLKISDCIFCGIVNGFHKKRGPRVAAKVHESLIRKGSEPGQVTYASMLNIYCIMGLYEKAEATFEEMIQKGFDQCVVAYSTMVVMYGKTGRLREAMKLVAKMKARGCQPNVWIYNELIDLHGRDRNLRQVDKLLKEMQRKKLLPDRITYTSVIWAYSKAREYEKCIEYYQEFRLNEGVVDLAMAGIMVGVFSKLNRIEELVRLLQDMKAEGTGLDERLYKSALNAFRDAGLELLERWLQEIFAGRTMGKSVYQGTASTDFCYIVHGNRN